MAQSQHKSRRQKIEPLNYLEMATAPALKGGISLLDITPEQFRTGSFEPNGVVRGPASGPSPVDVSAPGDETLHNSWTPIRQNGAITPITSRRPPQPSHHISPVNVSTPGDETSYRSGNAHAAPTFGVEPGRGRSQVRRCVLAQDGHSLGEEAIYQVMWRSGHPESSDPNSSRKVRIGAADLGMKVNMAKKNVRQNIARLFEKLSIEILENFDTMSSQARLYRVFSYKQILERRRAVGLEYVLRNKGVVFCSSTGEALVSSPAYVAAPGDETFLRPGRPRPRKQPRPKPVPLHVADRSGVGQNDSSEASDIAIVSGALNRYWAVDEHAAVQLVRACRRVRSDAQAEEIAFFVSEKVDAIRTNRNITNPTGLILSTVPHSFVGATFESFRRRLQERAAHEAEETARKEEERRQMADWVTEERARLEAIVGNDDLAQKERDTAEKELRQLAVWYP